MKWNTLAVALFCAGSWVCGAETVSYSIPVLTVQETDEGGVAPGSGRLSRCPFSWSGTTNDSPVKVSVIEDLPSGAGNSLRVSLWLAAATASLTFNRSLSGATVSFETAGYVDGHSAGGMLCLAVMSAMDGRPFPDDFAMTGTIMADGTVGPVGGVAEKLRAASKAGIKRVCIPAFTRMDEDFTDLLDLGKSLNIEMHQVATIAEAYRVLHRLPVRQMARLNSAEICRLPTQTEGVLKERFVSFILSCPRDKGLWNRSMRVSLQEYCAGLFGAAVIDMMMGLESGSFDACCVRAPDADAYPELRHELPTNGVALADGPAEKPPTKERYVAALKALHRDLKAVEDSLCCNDQDDKDASADENAPAESWPHEWFNDHVESPAAAQIRTLENLSYVKLAFYGTQCRDITASLDGIEDWSALDVADLNAVRAMLVDKRNLLAFVKTFNEDGENRERVSTVSSLMRAVIPYIRPNSQVSKVESLFYRTMMSVDEALSEGVAESGDSFFAIAYGALLRHAIDAHQQLSAGAERELGTIFAEAQALAMGCALVMCRATASSGEAPGNSAFYSSVVSTARENALANIDECLKADIPCVMPVVCFQLAESARDAGMGEHAEANRLMVLANYLQASLSAKALVLCFAGQKRELNVYGYCGKSFAFRFTDDSSTADVRYLGVRDEPILRDGFAGYKLTEWSDGSYRAAWLDLHGREVRVRDTNGCYTVEYDAAGRQTGRKFCNDSWVPTDRHDHHWRSGRGL